MLVWRKRLQIESRERINDWFHQRTLCGSVHITHALSTTRREYFFKCKKEFLHAAPKVMMETVENCDAKEVHHHCLNRMEDDYGYRIVFCWRSQVFVLSIISDALWFPSILRFDTVSFKNSKLTCSIHHERREKMNLSRFIRKFKRKFMRYIALTPLFLCLLWNFCVSFSVDFDFVWVLPPASAWCVQDIREFSIHSLKALLSYQYHF